MRQDRFGLGIADAVGQTGQRLETVDGDVMAGGDLRSQAQLPQRSSGPCQKVTTSGSIVSPLPQAVIARLEGNPVRACIRCSSSADLPRRALAR